MTSFRIQTGSKILPAGAALVGALLACSTGKGPSGSSGNSPTGAGGSTAGASSAGSTSSGASAGALVVDAGDGGSGVNPRPDLPPPWQYDDGSDVPSYKDSSLPADVGSKFGGAASTSGAPALVYPLNQSLHPMNLSNITFQWSQGAATNTVFRVQAAGGGQTFNLYVPCTQAQCTYAMPESEWLDLGKTFAGSSISITIQGTSSSGGAVASSAGSVVNFSPEPVNGALYYWAAGPAELKRADFGSAQAVPYITPNSTENEYGCVGCHSVSRDGSVIAFAVSEPGGEHGAAIQVAPTQDPATPYVRPVKGTSPFPPDRLNGITTGPMDHFGHFVALDPTGSVAAVVGIPVDGSWPPYFEIRDAKTGATLQKYELGHALFGENLLPILPEWSPDGKSIAVALGNAGIQNCLWTFFTCQSSIAIIPYEGNGQLGVPSVLVPTVNDEYHYYPSWSPDGKYLAFVSAKFNHDSQLSQTNPNGVIRLVKTDGGPYTCPGDGCWELANGTQYSWAAALSSMGEYSTWPKFTPFAQGTNNQLFFISFNSRIDYGFLAKNADNENTTQIWMMGVDVSKLSAGSDPSYAPIWLPYQDFEDEALTPYWTETLPCEVDPGGECAGCVNGEVCEVTAENECRCTTIVVK